MSTSPLQTSADWQLQLSASHALGSAEAAQMRGPQLPAGKPGVLVIALGTSGCTVAQRAHRDAVRIGHGLRVAYIDYPVPALPALKLTRPDGEEIEIPAAPFCPVGEAGDRRDRARQFPLLARRSEGMLRGTPVWEDRKLTLSGEGGGAIGPVTALDLDLARERIRAFLVEVLRPLAGLPATDTDAGSDFQAILGASVQREQAGSRPVTIQFVFGTTGATGNALSQLLPYETRQIAGELGIDNVRLAALALGPQAYRNLTPYVMHNFHALMLSLDHMARHGFKRDYIDGRLEVNAPPYDDLVLLDDPTLATDSRGRATATALDGFHDRAARALRLLLTSNLRDVVAARAVNDHERRMGGALDGRTRWISALSTASASADRELIVAHAAAELRARLLDGLATRLGS